MIRGSIVSVGVIAGPIHTTAQPFHDELGQQLAMNDDFHMHITPEVARQWISVLNGIAEAAE